MKGITPCPHPFQYESLRKISTKVTYLEMFTRPAILKKEINFRIYEYNNNSPKEYLDFYHSVGGRWNWTGRKLLRESELQEILSSNEVKIYICVLNDEFVGYVEFDLRKSKKDIEIVFFGITPQFLGQGIGTQFMNWVLYYAWDELKCERLWLHTCDFDHPNALNFYQKNNFIIYQEKEELVDLL